MLKKTYRNICNKRLELQFFRKSLLKNSEIIYYDIFKKLCKEYENNPEAEKYIASTTYTLPSYISDESETVNLAKLYNNSKIDLSNTIVFYPLKKEITNKLKTETITEWIPFSIKDLNDNIKSDLPSTEFHYPNNNIPVYSYIDYHVNAYEFEYLLIKIQTQEDTEQDIENPKQK